MLDSFFNFVTSIVVGPAAVIVIATLYWCIDKHAGWYVLTSFAVGNNINQTLKDFFCVPRPWLRSTNIHPSPAALGGATGYSFPSGHSQTAASIFGAAAWHYRKLGSWVIPLAIFLIGLAAFSRNILGVHTPQDVLVGIAIGILSLWLSAHLLNWMERKTTSPITVALTFLFTALALMLYTVLKPYPTQGIATTINVVEMQKDAFTTAGLLAGLGVSWWAEKRFVNFTIDQSNKRQIALRVVCGLSLIAACHLGILMPLKFFTQSGFAYKFCTGFLLVLAGMVGGPALTQSIEKHQGHHSTNAQ
ncbi:phosphatase PAP2 family protein [Atopobium fossor]|uniref:phosphatase PAP2 family protein n=1 Tax=Atopobium fossor TaxID=39487 RepID=UPI000407D915|nr:phosphatase PAP2 family protein [Atopobium fossor]